MLPRASRSHTPLGKRPSRSDETRPDPQAPAKRLARRHCRGVTASTKTTKDIYYGPWLATRDAPAIPYIPQCLFSNKARSNPVIEDVSVPLFMVEAPVKALSMITHGYDVIAVAGVEVGFLDTAKSIKNKGIYLPQQELGRIAWSGRVVYIAYDAGIWTNPARRVRLGAPARPSPPGGRRRRPVRPAVSRRPAAPRQATVPAAAGGRPSCRRYADDEPAGAAAGGRLAVGRTHRDPRVGRDCVRRMVTGPAVRALLVGRRADRAHGAVDGGAQGAQRVGRNLPEMCPISAAWAGRGAVRRAAACREGSWLSPAAWRLRPAER